MNPQDTAPGMQASEAQKHHEVTSILCENGFSPDRAEEFWAACDRTKEVEELIADAIAWAFQDNTAEVHGENGEQEDATEADRVPPMREQTPDFDVPPPSGQKDTAAADPEAVYEEVDPDHPESEADEEEASIETAASNQQFLNALPPILRELCTEIMRFLNIPALLPTVCILLAVSAALMRGLCCRSNRGITYANLFALLGADSAAGKSLTYNAAMGPLEELDTELLAEFEQTKIKRQAQLSLLKSDLSALNSKYTKAQKGGEELTKNEQQALVLKLEALHTQQAELEKQMTQEPSLWCSDFTGEALGVLLSNNLEQMSVSSDEGSLTLNNLLGRYNDGEATDDALLCKGFTVNAHKVHRISRESITLKKPCVSMLLLVQEDILRAAFANRRLVIGGFLARCFSAYCRLKMQEETEETEMPLSKEVLERWRKLIRELYFKFRGAESSCELKVEPKVRGLSRHQHNSIARMVNSKFRDIRSFAARWVEQTWKLAEVLHAGRYGAQCDAQILSTDTFEAAQSIIRLFCKEQLNVLGALRSEQLYKTHLRLQELFLQNDNKPMRLRELDKTHGLDRGQVEDCVRAYSKIYGLTQVKSPRGKPATLVFYRRSHHT